MKARHGLFLGARRYGETARFDPRFRQRIWRIIAASVVMGVVLLSSWILLLYPWALAT